MPAMLRVVQGIGILLVLTSSEVVTAQDQELMPSSTMTGDVTGDGLADRVTIFHPERDVVLAQVAVGRKDGTLDAPQEWLHDWHGQGEAYLLLDVYQSNRADLVIAVFSGQTMTWRVCSSDGRAFYNCRTVRDPAVARRAVIALLQKK